MSSSQADLHPLRISYIVFPDGIDSNRLIFGDSVSNTDVQGYFVFNTAIGGLWDKTILSVTLKLEYPILWGDPTDRGRIQLWYNPNFVNHSILVPDDYIIGPGSELLWLFNNRENPLIFSNEVLKNIVQDAVSIHELAGFTIRYVSKESDGDFQTDGREYFRDGITLSVVYKD